MVAEIIINSSVKVLNRIFDYEIPENMNVDLGSRVFVSFGNKKTLDEGIVIGIKEKSEYKKTMLPYVIGAILVFGITNVLGIIIDLISALV